VGGARSVRERCRAREGEHCLDGQLWAACDAAAIGPAARDDVVDHAEAAGGADARVPARAPAELVVPRSVTVVRHVPGLVLELGPTWLVGSSRIVPASSFSSADGAAEKTLTVPPSVNRPVAMTLAIPDVDVTISVMCSLP
jgi:hypothetical protein